MSILFAHLIRKSWRVYALFWYYILVQCWEYYCGCIYYHLIFIHFMLLTPTLSYNLCSLISSSTLLCSLSVPSPQSSQSAIIWGTWTEIPTLVIQSCPGLRIKPDVFFKTALFLGDRYADSPHNRASNLKIFYRLFYFRFLRCFIIKGSLEIFELQCSFCWR